MNPYKINTKDLKISRNIKDQKELLKLKLAVSLLKLTKDLDTERILFATGLHKSDLSRLRSLNIQRFSIDRLISILDGLGFSTNLDIVPKDAS